MARRPERYHHGNLRPALLRAALQLLDSGGPDAVTIRAVARRAAVSHAAPAHHFASRRELLGALVAQLFEQLAAQVDAALPGAPAAPARRVRVFADTLIDFGLAYPQRYRLLWRRELLDAGDPTLARAMDAIYERLVAELSAASGGRHDRHTYAVALWSMVHGYVSLRIEGMFVARGDPVSGERRERAIVSAFVDSIVGR